MKKILALANFASVILVLLVNGLSQSQRWNDTTIGEMSNVYSNLFTPAGYAFSIWGLIFLLLIVYGAFGIQRAFSKNRNSDFITKTSWWFVLANVCNALWVVAFTYDQIVISLLLMLIILASLLTIMVKNQMNLEGEVNTTERLGARIPISIYAGWITVATVANFSVVFVSLGVELSELHQVIATMVMITIATVIYILMVWVRSLLLYALVGVWAFAAIAVRHWESFQSISFYAMAAAIILLFVTVAHSFRSKEIVSGD